MRSRFTKFVTVLAVLSFFLMSLPLFPIDVENASFELPGTEKLKSFDTVPGWNTDTPPVDSGVEQGWGATDGAWTMFMKSGDPQIWQLTDHVLAAGETIKLSIDAKNNWQATDLQVTLYYDDAGARVVAAENVVAMTDVMAVCSVELVVDDVPAAIGNLLGIAFQNVSAEAGSWIGADNVRLSLLMGLTYIDGLKDPIFDTLTGPDDGYIQLRAFTGNDNGFAEGDMDLSAKVWTAWDETFFYIYEEVKDDMISMSSANSWNNDGLELKFDPQATDSVANSVFGLAMTVLGADDGVTGTADLPNSYRQVTADGYVLEAAVPWADIVSGAETVDVAVDSVFGLVIQNHDNDNNKGNRDASVQWAAVMKDAAWNQPKYLATAKFLADNKLQLIPSNNMTGVTNTLPYDGTVPAIIVDGEKDPFYYTLNGPEEGYLQLKSYAFNDNGIPESDADLSVKVWTAWDETNLYIYEEVLDDTISSSSANSWNNDGLELKFDPQATDSVANSVFGLAMTAQGEADGVTGFADITNGVRKITDNGYVIEAAVPWAEVLSGAETVDVAVDSVFGLVIQNHDNDNATGARDASVQWAAVLKDAAWNQPKYLATAKFKEGNKLELMPSNNMTGVTNPVPYDGTDFYIRIDAKKDPFYCGLTGPDDGYLQIRSYAFNNNGAPDDDADLSAKTWAAWDENRFYFYEEVKDDIILATNASSYNNDGLEIKIDPQPTKAANSVFSVELTALYEEDNAGTNNINTVTAAAKKEFARAETADGYVLELAIDWSALTQSGETISVAVDSVFGAAVMNHDNDATTREASVIWAAVMNDNVWNTPASHATVKFLPDHKLQFIPVNNINGTENDIPYDGSEYVGVEEESSNLPDEFALKQNYPNPFNPSTTISYTIPNTANVRLVIYDILGREVTTLVNEKQDAGRYQVRFNVDQHSSGVYLCKLVMDDKVQTLKMMMLK
ncbi:T9SS type A sorting domain-containing protein [bacterium]|nr:T9SS type A sorting domain-containing protein [bacterium]